MTFQGKIEDLQVAEVRDTAGDKVGKVSQVYLDDDTKQPSWVTVNTGLFGTKESFVPLADASYADGAISVPYEKSFIKDAPQVDEDGSISRDEEAELYRYYGVTDSRGNYEDQAQSDAGQPGTGHTDTSAGDAAADQAPGADGGIDSGTAAGLGAGTAAGAGAGYAAAQGSQTEATSDVDSTVVGDSATTGDSTDAVTTGDTYPTGTESTSVGTGTGSTDTAPVGTPATGSTEGESITLHEQRAHVGTERVESGKVRLRKYVVTDTQTVEVPVSREEIEIERVPVDGTATPGAQLSEGETEVTLHEERPVVTTETVATEQVNVGKRTVEGTQSVTTEGAHEELEVVDGVDGTPDTQH